MRKIREILRLKDCGRSQREIASALCVAVGTICGYLKRAADRGLTWERVQEMSDAEIEAALFRDGGRKVAASRAPIDYAHVHSELHKTGVTLQLLWSGYQESVAARRRQQALSVQSILRAVLCVARAAEAIDAACASGW